MATKRSEAEWAETYVFLKTIADGKIRLEHMLGMCGEEDLYIVDLIRRGQDEIRYYTGEEISIRKNGEEVKRVSALAFKRAADAVWTELKSVDGLFEDKETDGFLKSVLVDGSPLDEVGDIVAEARDCRVGMVREFRFACETKTWPELLFDAGEDGYFEYELSEVGDDVADEINSMGREGKEPSERIEYLKEMGASLMFSRVLGKCAKVNIVYWCSADTLEIVGEMVKFFCFDREGKDTAISEAVDYLSKTDAAHFAIERYHCVYSIRITRLLVAMFRGLNFSHIIDEARMKDRGLILAERDGETSVFLSCYTKEFENFLTSSVRFEAPFEGAVLSDIYMREDGRRCMKFPLRLRFDFSG